MPGSNPISAPYEAKKMTLLKRFVMTPAFALTSFLEGPSVYTLWKSLPPLCRLGIREGTPCVLMVFPPLLFLWWSCQIDTTTSVPRYMTYSSTNVALHAAIALCCLLIQLFIGAWWNKRGYISYEERQALLSAYLKSEPEAEELLREVAKVPRLPKWEMRLLQKAWDKDVRHRWYSESVMRAITQELAPSKSPDLSGKVATASHPPRRRL